VQGLRSRAKAMLEGRMHEGAGDACGLGPFTRELVVCAQGHRGGILP